MDKGRNCSKRAITPFATMFSTFSHRLSINQIIEISYFLTKYVQSRLLQNCRMRERVKYTEGMQYDARNPEES